LIRWIFAWRKNRRLRDPPMSRGASSRI
jgi:hypothetical protein